VIAIHLAVRNTVHTIPDPRPQRADETNHGSQLGIAPALRGGGEMGERIRAYDWTITPLGPIESWPAALHMAAGIVLGARAAMAIGWSPELTLLYNDACATLMGDRHPGALGQPARAVFREIWDTVGPLVSGVMSGQGAVEKLDQRLVMRRHGHADEAWFNYSFSPIRSVDGTVGGVLCVATETTGHVRAEQALRETERQYGELLQYAPAAIYELDFRRNRFVSVNDAMCRMSGYSREELLAMNPFDLTDAQGQVLFSRRIQQWLGGVEPDRNVEFRVKTKDGRTIDAVLDVTFTADAEGRPLGAAVVAHDITERKRREHQIERYNSVLRGINRIFEQVIRSETEEALGETCLEVVLEVTGSQVGFVGELGADGFLHEIAISDTGWAQCQVIDQEGHRRPPGDFTVHGLYGRVVDDGKGFFANDPSSHPDSIGLPPGHLPLTSFLGVPLTHEGKTIGMLAVANREGGYSAEQQEDLEALAPAVVEALLRKRAETQLRRERSLLDNVMQATDVMLVLLDPQFNFVWVNPAYAETCGMKPEEMIGKNHFALYPDEENEAIFRQVRDTGESVLYHDKPFVFPDQPERGVTYWDWSLAPLKGSTGDVTGLVFSLRETTKYVQTEQALRESEERAQWLARFPEENPSPVLRVSADGTVSYCNAAATAALGYQCQVGHRLSHEILRDLVGQALADTRVIQQDVELSGATFRVTVAPVAEEGYVNLYGVDITERVQAEEALRESRERLQAALDASGGTIYDHRVPLDESTYHDDRWAELLGYRRDELPPYDRFLDWLYEQVHPEDLPHLQRAYEDFVEGRTPGYHVEVRLRHKQGHWVWVEGYSNAVERSEDGRVRRIVGVMSDITERKEAEQALTESEELLRTVLENSRDGINMLDLQTGRYVFMSPAQVAMTGFTAEEMNSLPVEEAYARVHPDDRAISAAQQERLAQGLDDESVTEYRWKVKSGEYRWFSDSRKVLRDEQGKPVALVGTSRDITARRRVEEALRQYAERLRLLREVDEAILTARSAQEVAQAVVEGVPRLLSCLRASVLMRDQETGEMLMLAVYHRGETKLGAGQHGVLGPAESAALARLARGETVVVEDLQASPSTAPVVAQLRAEGVRAQVFEPIQIGGQLAGLLAVSMDVPGPVPADQQDVLRDLALQLAVGLEQVRLYEAVQRYAGDLEQLVRRRTASLEASEARFRTIFEEAALGMALTDVEGVLMATNPAMQRMLGYGEDELLGMRIFDFSRGVDEPCSTFPEELLNGQRAEYTLEQAYSRRDGEVGQANVTMSLLHRDTAQAPLVLVLAEDITERVQAQEALIRAEKLAILGRMTTSLAHEINNPIQSVVGCLGLAMEVLEDGEDATRFMEVALEESERAARIVQRLRDLSRSEEILREPSDVRELVDTVLVLTQNQAQNAHVALIWEGEDDLPPVPMVRDRIQQVFLNLVLNAIDAMPGGGDLHVHATRTKDPPGVSISFTDTGIGMPPEQIETLFEGLQTTKEMGLGLGLHVSRNIVEEHGGHIDVASQLGHGTTFTVWLPLP
jgi:PAS domain S-box-containing protein